MSLYFCSLDGLIEEHLMNVYLGLRNIYPQLIKIIANCEDMMKGDGGGWNGLIEKKHLTHVSLVGLRNTFSWLIISNCEDMMKGGVLAGVMEKHLTTVYFQERELST